MESIKIEACGQTELKGKWLIIAQKNKINQVRKHVEEKLNKIYSRGEGQTKMIRFTRITQRKQENNSVVGSYAEVLKRMAGNYDFKKNGQKREQFDSSHYQQWKRRNMKIDLTTNDKNKKLINENYSEISTITNETDALRERIQQLEKKTSELKEKEKNKKETSNKNKNLDATKEEIIQEVSTIINDKMKAFEVIQDKKLVDVTKTIAQTVSEGIMNSVTNQMEKSSMIT